MALRLKVCARLNSGSIAAPARRARVSADVRRARSIGAAAAAAPRGRSRGSARSADTARRGTYGSRASRRAARMRRRSAAPVSRRYARETPRRPPPTRRSAGARSGAAVHVVDAQSREREQRQQPARRVGAEQQPCGCSGAAPLHAPRLLAQPIADAVHGLDRIGAEPRASFLRTRRMWLSTVRSVM